MTKWKHTRNKEVTEEALRRAIKYITKSKRLKQIYHNAFFVFVPCMRLLKCRWIKVDCLDCMWRQSTVCHWKHYLKHTGVWTNKFLKPYYPVSPIERRFMRFEWTFDSLVLLNWSARAKVGFKSTWINTGWPALSLHIPRQGALHMSLCLSRQQLLKYTPVPTMIDAVCHTTRLLTSVINTCGVANETATFSTALGIWSFCRKRE